MKWVKWLICTINGYLNGHWLYFRDYKSKSLNIASNIYNSI